MNLSKSLKLLGIAAILMLALRGPVPLFAQQPADVQLGITPLDSPGQFFDLKMAAGATRSLRVEIGNYGTQPVDVRTFPADVYTIINGGFGARLDGEPTSGTTLWLTYPVLTANLAPKGAIQRSFTLTVPPDTKPGDYITSLVVQNAEPLPSVVGSIALLQFQRKAIAIAITVSDQLPPAALIEGQQAQDTSILPLVLRKPLLVIGKAEHKYVAATSIVTVAVANEGNVNLWPVVDFVLTDDVGHEVNRFNVAMDTVYVGTATSIEVPFTKPLLPGSYEVSLKLDYQGGTVEASQIPLEILRPTKAEAAGAPTDPDLGKAIANQRRPSRGHSLSRDALILGAMAVVLSSLAFFFVKRRTADR